MNLSSSPALLACIGASCPPATFLDLATSCLIDKSDEAGVRSEDPQGSMTRFGEGVVLVETFAAQYKVSHLIAPEKFANAAATSAGVVAGSSDVATVE